MAEAPFKTQEATTPAASETITQNPTTLPDVTPYRSANGLRDFINRAKEIRAQRKRGTKDAVLRTQIENETKRTKEADERALKDSLTGLHNKAWFNEELPRRMSEARRNGKSIWTLVADIDHFKRLNDKYGHDVGDKILAAWGEITARADEPFARYGGEEFVQILQDGHNTEEVQAIISRFANDFADITEKIVGTRETLSFGMARMDDTDTAETLFKKADQAAYNSKRTGRDRISVFDGSLEEPKYTTLEILSREELAQRQLQIKHG